MDETGSKYIEYAIVSRRYVGPSYKSFPILTNSICLFRVLTKNKIENGWMDGYWRERNLIHFIDL